MTFGSGKILIQSFVITGHMLEEDRLTILLHDLRRQDAFCCP